MNTALLFRRLVYAQVLLGIVASCMAERNPGLLVVAGTIGAMSWYATEGPRGRTIPRWVVNVGAILAIGWMSFELLAQRAFVVAAMGHFTMALQLMMLYGRKTGREYAQLLVLSLLQVIGASVLSVSMIYGVFLAVYCAVALATVLLFHLTSTADKVHAANMRASAGRPGLAKPTLTTSRAARRQLRVMSWVIGGVCGTVAVAVFVAMPRTGKSGLDFGTATPRATTRTGFSNTVRLGVGPIGTGSREPVLNLKIKTHSQSIGWEDEPWLVRGAALDAYNSVSHTWYRSHYAVASDRVTPIPKLNAAAFRAGSKRTHEYTAEIALRDARQRTIFSITAVPSRHGAPSFRLAHFESENLAEVSYSPLDEQLRATESVVGAATYSLSWPITAPRASAALRRHETPGAATAPGPQAPSHWPRTYQGFVPSRHDGEPPVTAETYTRTWRVQTQRVRAYANRILLDAGYQRAPEALHTPDDLKMAAALGEHLRRHYAYDLDNPPPRSGQDPVIAFLFETRRGHCELFAAGLAAMCRSVGIPARLVTGFRASEFNTIGQYYVVRQSNAHAWTEVNGGPIVGWTTFDATPSAEVRAEHQVPHGLLATVREFYEHIEFAWIKTIVAFDSRTQQAVLENVGASVHSIQRRAATLLRHATDRLKQSSAALNLNRLEALAVALSGVGLVIAATILVRLYLTRRRRLTKLQLTALPLEQRRGLGRRLGFYLTMLDLLERHGHRRPAWQSPSRFAAQLAEADPLRFDPVVALTDLFYEVRFGHRELNTDRRQRIKNHLKSLEQSITRKAK